MCSTCGCGQPDDAVKILMPDEVAGKKENHVSGQDHHDHVHHHDHDHQHQHDHHQDHGHQHGGDRSMEISLEQNLLQENNLLAERNRGYLEAKNIFTLNLVSSPGSGKTTLLEKSIEMMKPQVNMAIIEGDQQSMQDAERIKATGVPVVQINTGKGCHLDAHMVLHAIKKLEVVNDSLLFIENVGNLVCPAMFDLGENKRVVIISVTEGEDKPLKYPYMFDSSDICIINKIDLLPYVDFDVEKVRQYAGRINHHLQFFEVSATTGAGMEQWIEWLRSQVVTA